MVWTPENIERVKAMAASGLSATQVAGQIGGVSRNSIIGIAHRNKFQFTGKSGNPNPPGSTRTAPDRVFIPKSAIAPLKPGEAFPQSRLIPFADLERGECRFPFGNSDFRFCALPVVEGRSYCRHHTIVTMQPR